MKKKEIEKEMINLAYLRWWFIREKDDYKKDFKKLIDNNPEQKDNPLIFGNFNMLPIENLKQFKDRVQLYLSIITSEGTPQDTEDFPGWNNPWWEPIHYLVCVPLPSWEDYSKKWRYVLPVDSAVDYPNPFALEALFMSNPVIKLGNYCINHIPTNKPETFRIFLDKSDLGDLHKYCSEKFGVPVVSYIPPWIAFELHLKNERALYETKRIILDIDLNQDIKYIKSNFNQMISEEKKRLVEKGVIKPTKKNKEVMAKMVKVYRLYKEGKKWPAIAKEIFPYDFKDPLKLQEENSELPNPESAIVKVQQYYKRAEELIREAR